MFFSFNCLCCDVRITTVNKKTYKYFVNYSTKSAFSKEKKTVVELSI